MTLDKSEKPNNLIDGLSVTPFTYLIPKQDVAPLIGSASIQMIDNDLIDKNPNSAVNQMRIALNKDPVYFQNVINFLVEDFRSDDQELEDIKFKKPIFHISDNNESVDLGLPYLEQRLMEAVIPVNEDSIVESQYKSFDEKPQLRMEFPKSIDSNINQKLETNIIQPENNKHDHQIDLKRKHSDAIAPVLIAKEVEKKPKVEAYTPIKIERKPLIEAEEIEKKTINELTHLIDLIGLVDDDIDTADNDIWLLHNDEVHILSESVLSQFDSCLKRIVNKPSFELIDVEYLIRIESLANRSIKYCLDLNCIPLIDDAISDDMSELIKLVTNGLKACTVCLTILNCQRVEKQLFLEDYLKSILDFISLFIEDVIIPLAAKTIVDPKFLNNFKYLYAIILQSLSKSLLDLSYYIKHTDIDDSVLTKLEYLSSKVIFAEANTKEKSSILGIVNFESLRLALCDIICIIFQSKADQRQFILDEILSSFEKLPSHRVAARQFKLTRGINIQLATALLMRIIHTFDISAINFEKEIWKLDSSKTLNGAEKQELQYGKSKFLQESNELFREATLTANNIVSFLLSNLVSNPDAAHKHSFELLLEDLLNVLEFPEWPAAETLLLSIMKTFLFVIDSNNYPSLVETFALEMIGLIGVKMLHLKGNTTKENISSISNLSIEKFLSITSNYESCLQYLELASTKESKVKQSYHFLFLKLVNYLNSLLGQFQQEHEAELAELASSQSQDLNAHLSKKTKSDLLKNVDNIYYKLLVVLEEGGFRNSNVLDSNRDSNSVFVYAHILLCQDLLQLYDNFLNLILRSLDHVKIKARTRAIKNLSSLIAKEPSLLTLSHVRVSISKRLTDTSPLVRDAVIDLLSQYVVSKPEVIEEFYQPTCERINDQSVQVRKRVIKLVREMYIHTDKKHIKALIAEKLLFRIHDEEDSISDLVKSYLIELWFTLLVRGPINPVNSSLATSALSKIEVIIEVIGRSETNLELFETFLNNFVLHKDENNKKVYDDIMKAVKILVEKTLDFIIDCSNATHQKQVEKAMGLLSVLAKSDHKLIDQDQLISLQPYLMNEESTGDVLCFYTLQTFRYTLPNFTILKPNFIDVAQKSLLRRLTKFNVKELNEAIPCIWMLSVMKNDTIKIVNAAASCLKMIRPFLDELNTNSSLKVDPKLQRLLYLIGNFGRYCDFESNREVFTKAKIGMKPNETVLSLITKTLLFFCKETSEKQIKRVAIRNLINICSMHAKLFMSEAILNVLDREFGDDEVDIKGVMIQGTIDFLEKEEADSIKRNGLDVKSSRNTKLDVAVFHGESQMYMNDGICVSIVQRFMNPILEICLYDDGTHSYLPVKFLQLVVKLGFANPRLCIPTIIALEATPTRVIKDMSFAMHSDLIEKHETLIESSYVEGIRLAVSFRKKNSKNLFQERFFFKGFYSVIKDGKSAKRKFFTSLIKSFSVPVDFKDIEKIVFQKDYLNFLFLNISNVELSTLEEVYILVHGLDKVLMREGINLSYLILQKEKDGATDDEWIYLATASQGLSTIITFKQHLFKVYNLSEDKLREFQVNKVDKDLRQAPKSVHDHALDLGDLESLYKSSASVDKCKQVCLDYIQLTASDLNTA